MGMQVALWIGTVVVFSLDQARHDSARYVAELPRADLAAGILEPSAAAAESLFGQIGFTSASRSFIEDKARAFLAGRI
jgi:hypothetical protein